MRDRRVRGIHFIGIDEPPGEADGETDKDVEEVGGGDAVVSLLVLSVEEGRGQQEQDGDGERYRHQWISAHICHINLIQQGPTELKHRLILYRPRTP